MQKNLPLSEITPYKKNAKEHPLEQIDKISRSIQAFGFNQPLVLDKDKVIIVGHGRYLAAQQLGWDEVPCIIVDLPKDKAEAYRLADNKLNESEWNLTLVIESLKDLDVELAELTGFDDFALEADKPEVILKDLANEGTGTRSFTVYLDDERMEEVESIMATYDGGTVSEKFYTIIKKIGYGDKKIRN